MPDDLIRPRYAGSCTSRNAVAAGTERTFVFCSSLVADSRRFRSFCATRCQRSQAFPDFVTRCVLDRRQDRFVFIRILKDAVFAIVNRRLKKPSF